MKSHLGIITSLKLGASMLRLISIFLSGTHTPKRSKQEQNFIGEKKKDVFLSSEKENMISCNLDSKQNEKHAFSQGDNKSGDSLLSIFSLGDGNYYDTTSAEELQAQKRKKKKKKGIRR